MRRRHRGGGVRHTNRYRENTEWVWKLPCGRGGDRGQGTKLSLRTLKAFFRKDTRAVDITADRVDRYIAHRLEKDKVARGTVQKECAALKRAFNLAREKKLLDHVPHIPNLQLRNARTGFFERGDFEAVLAKLPEYLRAPMRFEYLTGWRVKSEVLPLTWAQVDFDAGVVRLEPETTKNREGRVFPFSALPELEALLRDQRERTKALERKKETIIPLVFHRDGRRIKGYKRAWTKARKAAGLPDALVHDLRRTAVRNLVRAGVPEIVAMRLCGHKTRAVFDRYAITDEGMLQDGVEKLPRLHRAEADGKPTAAVLGAGDDTFSTQSPAEALRAVVAESAESADGTTG